MWAVRAGIVGLMFLVSPKISHAKTRGGDSVTRLVKQLTKSHRYKLRLSAAVNLGKTRDPRAIVALSFAARKDKSTTIRRIAIAGLAKLANRPQMPSDSVREALTTISRVASKDRSRKVRRAASAAKKKLAKARRRIEREDRRLARSNFKNAKLFVAVGRPNDPSRRVTAATTLQMGKTVSAAIKRRAPNYDIGTINESGSRGRAYYVGATIAAVSTARQGLQTEVRCEVSIRVSPLKSGREHFISGESASARGSGRVLGASGVGAVTESKRQCVLAVVEQVTERQVVPFIRRIASADTF